MKKIGIILGILLILVFLAAVLAPFVVDLNRYKGTILSTIKPYVPREVDFDHIELTVLTGLGFELRGLRVADNPAFSTGDFIRLEGLQVRVMFLPLLKRQIKVKRVVLKRPEILLERNAKGAFSFQDLLQGATGGTGVEGSPPRGVAAAGKQAPTGGEIAGGAGFLAGLLVNELAIQQGKVVYRDEMLWPGRAPLVIDAIDVDVRDLCLERPVSVQMRADVLGGTGQNLALAGTVGPVGQELRPEAVPFDLQISLKKLPLGTLMSLLPSPLPVPIDSGTGSLRWTAKGSLDREIVSHGEVDLQDIRLKAEGGQGEGGSEPAAVHCTVAEKIVLEAAKEKITVESLDVSLNEARFRMQGTVESFKSDPRWEGKAWTEGFRPDLLVSTVPALARAVPPGLHFEGPLTVRLESEGTRDEFRLKAGLDMEKMGIAYEDLFRKPSGGKFSIRCKAVKKGEHVILEGLELLLHTLAMNASGEVVIAKAPRFGLLIQTNPVALEGWDTLCPAIAPYQPKGSFVLRSSLRGTPEDASMNLQVSSDTIGFVVPPAEGIGGDGKDRSGLLKSCNIKVQAKKRSTVVSAVAQAEVRQGKVLNVPFARLTAGMTYNPPVVEISGVDLNVFQGEIQAKGSYDPEKGVWRFNPRLRDVSVGEILDRLTEYKDEFSGIFRGEFSIDGSTRPGSKQAMNAQGSFRISEGVIKNFNLVGSVMDALFGLKGMAGRLKSSRTEIRKHESTRFDWLDGAFRMSKGVLHLKGLHLRNVGTSKATDADALLTGTMDMERQLLDMKGKVILSKRHSAELANKAEIMKALFRSDRRIVLPVTLKGKVQMPVVFLDTEYVLGAVSRYYARQGVDKLRKQLGLPAERQGGEEKPVERLLRELFKKR